MRFCDLKGLSDEVAFGLIEKCPQVEMKEALDNPEIFSGKFLVFLGNYDGFDTNRLCARTFEYISTEHKWKVSDVSIYDFFISSYFYHFSKPELQNQFYAFCNARAFLMDA